MLSCVALEDDFRKGLRHAGGVSDSVSVLRTIKKGLVFMPNLLGLTFLLGSIKGSRLTEISLREVKKERLNFLQVR